MVIPAYNEANRLPRSLKDVKSFFQNHTEGLEVLVVIEKSTDDTLRLAQAEAAGHPFIRVIDNQVQKGKGFAVRSGMLQAKGEYVFFTDADLSTPLAEVFSFMSLFSLNPEVDVILGSRKHPKSAVVKKQNWFRQKMGETFNKMVMGLVSIRGIKDTQCGFKAFRKQACAEIFSRQTLNGFSFDVEVILLAQVMGYKTLEAPVRWVNSPESKVRIVRDSIRMAWELTKMKRRVRRALKQKPFLLSKGQ